MRTLIPNEIAGFDRSKQSHVSRGTAFDLLQFRPVRGDLEQVDHLGYFVDEFGEPQNDFSNSGPPANGWYAISEDYIVSASEAYSAGGWASLSEDYVVSASESFNTLDWESFDET